MNKKERLNEKRILKRLTKLRREQVSLVRRDKSIDNYLVRSIYEKMGPDFIDKRLGGEKKNLKEEIRELAEMRAIIRELERAHPEKKFDALNILVGELTRIFEYRAKNMEALPAKAQTDEKTTRDYKVKQLETDESIIRKIISTERAIKKRVKEDIEEKKGFFRTLFSMLRGPKTEQ